MTITGLAVQSHPISYHAWITLPEGERASHLSQRLLQRGVDNVPGEEFAVANQEGSAYVRLSLGGETMWSRLEQGIRLFLEEIQKPIL